MNQAQHATHVSELARRYHARKQALDEMSRDLSDALRQAREAGIDLEPLAILSGMSSTQVARRLLQARRRSSA